MKRLLIFELHLLGDAVMSLPFLRAAGQRYEVHVACSPAAARLYALVLPPEQVHLLELPDRRRPASLLPFLGALGRLRRLRACAATTVWADVRVHLLMRVLGIPGRLGFPMNEQNYYAHHVDWRQRNLRRGERFQRLLGSAGLRPLTVALERTDYLQHHVADWAQLAEALALEFDLETPWLEAHAFPLPPAARPFFEANVGRKIWLLHPGAAKETKRWLHFAEIARDFFGRHQLPLVILQDPAMPPIASPHANCLVWPISSLGDFIALAAASDVVLGNDSAAGHIGAALKKEVVTIFGSGSSAWFAPYRTRGVVLESGVCPCRPCFDRCVQPSIICLEDIAPARVLAALEKVEGKVEGRN